MASVKLTAEPHSVRRARLFLNEQLDAAGAKSSPALLLTSELASNVVQHARTGFELVVDVSPELVHVELHDGRAIDAAFRELIERHPGAPAAEAVSGRGLLLLTSSAMSCGLIDKGDDGKAVWFEVATDDE